MHNSNPDAYPSNLFKRRSQHFLANKEILQYEASLLECKGLDVLEIGAGDGRLSEFVLEEIPKSLSLVELDPYWAGELAKKFKKSKNVKILQGDFLELPNNYKANAVIGNIPYQITSKIILKLARMKFKRAVLCMQKEVAQRIFAPPCSNEYGRLSVFCQLHYDIKPGRMVPKNYFHPPPQVDSQIVKLVQLKGTKSLPKNLELATSSLFSHRLASVENALFHSRRAFGWDKAQAVEQISKRVKLKGKKVFMLTPQEVVEIAKSLPMAGK